MQKQKNYIIAIDEGTSSVRAVLFDVKKNKIVSSFSQGFQQIYPEPGWVEHNAEEIWQKTELCLKKMLNQISHQELFGIGITNQRETVVAWNRKTGKPIYNAICWQCRRTADLCNSMQTKVVHDIHKKTGLIIDAYFSATKIKWLKDNVPAFAKEEKAGNLCVGTIESFLVFKLTGGKSFVTDITNASRTMLLNINTKKWDKSLLELFDISENILPEIVDNNKIVGEYKHKGHSITIAGLIGDQQSSLFGQACFEKGDSKNTFGTGSFLLLNTGQEIVYSKHKLITTIAWQIDGKPTYALEGSVFNCGTSIEWLKDLGIIKKASDCDSLANSVPSSNGVYFVPAFTGLGAPYWDGNARGLICGITRGTSIAHITRAVLDSIAFSVKDVYDIMLQDANLEMKKGILRADGGVSKSEFTMQYQSNLLGLNVQCCQETESTSLGAIYMCGLATGAFKNIADLKKRYKPAKIYKPKKSFKIMTQKYEGWKDAIARTLSKRK